MVRWGHKGRRLLAAAVGVAAAAGVWAGPSVEALPPQICFPVAGGASYVETFGAPRSGGRTHMGNDLFAPKHTPVVATVDGYIDYVKTDNGGLSGRAIGLIGTDGWRYRYIHLDNDNPGTDDGAAPVTRGILPGLRPGDVVLAGQVLGWSGDSGNAETTSPHVHFEIRRPDGVAVTPYPALRGAAACGRPRAVGIAAHPGGGAWVLTATGRVVPVAAPVLGETRFGFDIARDIAAMPDGNGYVVLDGWGGVHRFGSAAALPGSTPYWPGHDVARAIAIAPDGAGFAVLDAYGGVHTAGSLDRVLLRDQSYWDGWDIARDLAVTPDGLGYVVLDGLGGVHASGSATVGALLLQTPAFPDDRARTVALDRLTLGAYVLDAGGTVTSVGTADAGTVLDAGPPWAAIDLADHRVAVRSDGLTRGW